ncbi:MAG: phosphotransferase [Acidobacteria bacterium]|nr:phosphotransferase [Acidobacteriota bacterium]
MSDRADTRGQEAAFRQAAPGGFYVDPSKPEDLEAHLLQHGLLNDGEQIRSVRRAGEGNMNLTLRVVTSERSFVLKQSRPWVEKYPQIAAPVDRALVEIAFYETVAALPEVRRKMPRLLGSDRASRLLLLDDLGEAQDLTALYAGERLRRGELDELVDYLVALHSGLGAVREDARPVFENRDMRALNHEHIFRLPLADDNGLDLDGFTPGLGAAAARLKSDQDYVSRVEELGSDYLADGDTLVHGDYFPGSWLRTSSGVCVIDPEFCFLGPRMFDVGFMLGHLHLAGQPDDTGLALLSRYTERADVDAAAVARAKAFAGVEIMRRLIGVAQLPLDCGIERKSELLRLSRDLVLTS